MRRSHRSSALALVLLAVAAAGCQDYHFIPAKGCLIQPGSEEVVLPRISSADVLFVVDDSNSMAGKQDKLAGAFDTFVASLNAYNDLRAANHLEPFDFHLAITTTSVFYDQPTSATCQATCGTSSNVCGTTYTSGTGTTTCSPMRIAKTCPSGTGCGTGYSCKTTCSGHAGEAICCDASGANVQLTTVSCTSPGAACGQINERYAFDYEPVTCSTTVSNPCPTSPYDVCTGTGATQACGSYPGSLCCAPQACTTSADCPTGFACGAYTSGGSTFSNICVSTAYGYPAGTPQTKLACVPGVGANGALYPHGDFVGIGANPRVLHFDKSLYATPTSQPGYWEPVVDATTNGINHQGFHRADLAAYFKQNVHVGTCGSGEEQGLQGARLAVTKALAGRQYDVVNASGQQVAAPGVIADWPHAGAKLVVVYVGDEDDCSSPADPVRGLILTGAPPVDSCQQDQSLPLDQQKEYRVSDFVAELTGLGRPLGAAFIVSATASTCEDAYCAPAVCAPDSSCLASYPANQCGGVAPGTRFIETGAELRGAGADVIDGSICNGDFGTILGRIAEIVKPPSSMTLPTQPASAEMTMLRITTTSGDTRKVCRGPALPPLTAAQAAAAGYDWWFMASGDPTASKDPSAASRYLWVNHATLNCEPNPGEGYSADYLGVVPPGGCTSDAACTSALGKGVEWTCYAGTDASGKCVVPSSSTPGTCLCNSRPTVCPNG